MKRPIKIFLFTIASAFIFNSSAVAGDELAITLEQAIRLAIKNNPSALQASEKITIQQANLSGAKGNFLPTLSLGAQGGHHQNSSLYSADMVTQNGDDDYESVNVNVTASISVFDGYSNKATLNAAKLELNAAKASKTWTEQSLAFNVATQFYEVLKSRELVSLEEENLEQNRLQLEEIESFYKVGKVSVTDLFQQKSEMSQAKLNLLEAKNTLKTNRLLLAQILGVSESTMANIITSNEQSISLLPISELSEDLLRDALLNRADVQSQNLIQQAREHDITKASSGYWPKVNLYASAGSSYSSMGNTNSFADQFSGDDVVTAVGINLSIPLFDGFSTRSAVSKAKAEKRTEILESRKLKQQVAVDLMQAIENYKTAIEQVNVAAYKVEATRMALDAMEERYNVHASTFLELASARTAYFEACYYSITSIYSQTVKRLAVEYQKGDLLASLTSLEKEKTNEHF